MAVKSIGQVSILDITDAYTLQLTADAFSLIGDADGKVATAQTLTTTLQAYRGNEAMTSASVVIGSIQTPTGVTATASGLTITLSVGTTCTGGNVSIPVTLDGDIVLAKTVSISVARKGATGSQGTSGTDGTDGADAIVLTITSSNGTIFKNSSGSTVLTAHVTVGGAEKSITSGGVVSDNLGTIYWYKGSTKVTTPSKTLTVTASEVSSVMNITCQLEQEDE